MLDDLWGVTPLLLEILLGVSVTFITVLMGRYAHPLGGIAYALLSIPGAFPYIGRPYRFLITDGILQASFLFKFIGFVLSSSGIICPLIILQVFYPQWLVYPPVLWGVFIGAWIMTFQIMHDVHLMRTQSYNMIFSEINKSGIIRQTGLDFSKIDEDEHKRLARSHFADMAAIRLLTLAVSYSVVSYTGTVLGLFSNESDVKDPIDALKGTLTIASIFSGDSLKIGGSFFGVVVNAFYGISLFFFVTFFIALASEMIDKPKQKTLEYPGRNPWLPD